MNFFKSISSKFKTLNNEKKRQVVDLCFANVELKNHRINIVFSPFLQNLVTLNDIINVELSKDSPIKDFDGFCYRILNVVEVAGIEPASKEEKSNLLHL